MDVIGIGYAAIDYLFVVPRYPLIDEKLEYKDFSIQGGGPAATALVAVTRLGGSASYIGCIGNDDSGDFIIREFEKENVSIEHLIRENKKSSPLSVIMVDERTGKRTILWKRRQLKPYPADLITEKMFKKCKVLHLDGFEPEAALKAVTLAKGKGITIVVDAGSVKEGMEILLKESDYFVASSVFSENYTKEPDRLKALYKLYDENRKCVVVTYGEEGSIGIIHDRLVRIPAYKVSVKDTTGAGDVFHGAFIYGVLQQWELEKTMRFASATSALKCMHLGGREGIPNLEQVNSFLKKTI